LAALWSGSIAIGRRGAREAGEFRSLRSLKPERSIEAEQRCALFKSKEPFDAHTYREMQLFRMKALYACCYHFDNI
jgi:hypothetical protein